MRRIFIIVCFSILSAVQCNAVNRISSIKDSIVSFLRNTENLTDSYKSESLSDALICELNSKKRINETSTGVFWFTTLSSHSYTHIIIVRENSYQILNMREPLDNNILLLCDYLSKNRGLSAKDVIDYIDKLIDIHRKNMSIRSDVFIGSE